MKTRTIRPMRMSNKGIMPSSVDKPIYPKITLSFKDLPEAKKWKNGETYDLELTVKQVGSRDDEYNSEATFEIRKIGVDTDQDD